MTSQFSGISAAPAVEIFALNKTFKEDTFADKVDIAIGAYRDDDGKPWVLPVVRKVEMEIANNEKLNHEYSGILGNEEFTKSATAMLLGSDNVAIKENRAFAVQALSGTGGLRLAGDFLVKCGGFKIIYISQPTWPNHKMVFDFANFTEVRTYRYWDEANRNLNFDGMISDLKQAPEKSVIVLHACAHNPTGIDPTADQWKEIADVMEERNLFPLFDCAYQGFASGDLTKDAFSVRYFVERGFELLGAQSFAKNFGLYDARVGNLTVVLKESSPIVNMKTQLTTLVRANYSNPPAHGARIVHRVLSDKQLYEEWQGNIQTMANRIIKMREELRKKLEEQNTPGTWDHITSQIGMFSYTGLTVDQVKHLVDEYHIYLPKCGRISICGISSKNIDYVAKAINDAIHKFP